MNILFFLTPKSEVEMVEETDTLRQVLEKMEHHGYSAVPIITKDGKYAGTITEGDILWELHRKAFPSLKEIEEIAILSVPRKRDNQAIHISTDMEGLLDKALGQNFVPVVDDDSTFIGIITRRDIILYLNRVCTQNCLEKKNAAE